MVGVNPPPEPAEVTSFESSSRASLPREKVTSPSARVGSHLPSINSSPPRVGSHLPSVKKYKRPSFSGGPFGDSCRIQTCNLLIRSQMLYSVELTNQLFLFRSGFLSRLRCKVTTFFRPDQIFPQLFSKNLMEGGCKPLMEGGCKPTPRASKLMEGGCKPTPTRRLK